MEDLLGAFGANDGSNGAVASPTAGSGSDDLMNGFASLDMNAGQPPPAQTQLSNGGGKKTNEDLLGLF